MTLTVGPEPHWPMQSLSATIICALWCCRNAASTASEPPRSQDRWRHTCTSQRLGLMGEEGDSDMQPYTTPDPSLPSFIENIVTENPENGLGIHEVNITRTALGSGPYPNRRPQFCVHPGRAQNSRSRAHRRQGGGQGGRRPGHLLPGLHRRRHGQHLLSGR